MSDNLYGIEEIIYNLTSDDDIEGFCFFLECLLWSQPKLKNLPPEKKLRYMVERFKEIYRTRKN